MESGVEEAGMGTHRWVLLGGKVEGPLPSGFHSSWLKRLSLSLNEEELAWNPFCITHNHVCLKNALVVLKYA